MTLNDFFAWNMRRFALSNDLPPLTEDDCDELFSLFAEAGLPDTAMSEEMADGYLTTCVIGPEPPAVHHWRPMPLRQRPEIQKMLRHLTRQDTFYYAHS
jgi:hypothetical protein